MRPLRRSDYHVLVDQGAFEGEHLELLHGFMVTKVPQGPAHGHAITKVTMLLVPPLVGRAQVRVQMAFAASEDSEPEPDLAVVREEEYLDDHPSRAWLVVEVGVSSLRLDRGAKAALYASSNVQEYWVVDMPASTVTVYASPVDGAWRTMTTHGRESTLAVPGFPNVTVRVADILPPPG